MYCRTARHERIFADAREAQALLDIFRDLRDRDGFAILAWSVMPTHYHLALRTGEVPLWRSMRLVQGRFAQSYNQRHKNIGGKRQPPGADTGGQDGRRPRLDAQGSSTGLARPNLDPATFLERAYAALGADRELIASPRRDRSAVRQGVSRTARRRAVPHSHRGYGSAATDESRSGEPPGRSSTPAQGIG
ncbi:MAG: transposase [Thermoanaerobaculaceae bacterium]